MIKEKRLSSLAALSQSTTFPIKEEVPEKMKKSIATAPARGTPESSKSPNKKPPVPKSTSKKKYSPLR